MKKLWAEQLLIFFILISGCPCQRPILPDLPSPRIVILGPTGAGKSSLANALLGCDPRAPTGDCMFTVCTGMDSCTKETNWGCGPWLGSKQNAAWLGSKQNFTVVDTPGFSDSNGEDEILIEEMMEILSTQLDHADTLLLLLDGLAPRFTDALTTMMKRMNIMFGQHWWEWLLIGVSKWSYSQDAIDARQCYPEWPDLCKDEAWFAREINQQIYQHFGINRNFTYVFLDSWSQTPGPPGFNTEDPLQQTHWQNQTNILWDITVNREEDFYFLTIEDILEENARQRAEIGWLNDVITSNISQMAEQIAENAAQIAINTEEMTSLHLAPVGTITAWVSKPSKGDDTEPENLPDGWMRCDGSTIPDGIWKGKLLPNLNGENRFLRGGVDEDMLETQEDMVLEHQHAHTVTKHSHTVDPHTHDVKDHTHTVDPHKHPVNAHTHTVDEHTHTVNDHAHTATDKGHTHDYKDMYDGYISDNPCACNQGKDGTSDHARTSLEGKADIKVASAEVTMDPYTVVVNDASGTMDSKTVVLHAASVEMETETVELHDADVEITIEKAGGPETRPKNMFVIYIMRVW